MGKKNKGHAVVILVVTSWGIPLVRDPNKPVPIYWKLPGGKGELGETPKQTAIRELEEEVGFKIQENLLELVGAEDRGSHLFFLFRASADATIFGDLKDKGDEGEEIAVFKPQEILAMEDFFPSHRKMAKEILESLPIQSNNNEDDDE